MSASYPTSPKTFTSRSAGQTIASAHVNDLQDELNAVEGGLLNGIAHNLLPDANNTRDFGSNAKRWATGYFQSLQVGGSALGLDNGICDGRLTLTTGTPVTTADVTGATSIYWTPYKGNRIALYDGVSLWSLLTFSELTLAVGTLTSGLPYDIFAYNNSGTVALRAVVAWTNGTTRATALTLQDGVLVKTGATTDRYLGTFYTTATTTTEDSEAKRFLWNFYNRVERSVRIVDTTDTWAFSTNGWQQANNSTANQIAVVVGWAERVLALRANHLVTNSTGTNRQVLTAIGWDALTPHANGYIGQGYTNNAINQGLFARLDLIPAVGFHFGAWLEHGNGTDTQTWYGDGGTASLYQTGLSGTWAS